MPPIALRLAFLRPGLRHRVLPQPAFAAHHSSWTKPPRFSSHFFTRTAAPSPPLTRRLLWLVPLAGGFVFFISRPRHESSNIFASPDLIPCPPTPPEPLEPVIMSPSEADRTILARILSFLRNRVFEPILTAKRFVYLCCLFLPVLLTSPMLIIGQPEDALCGDRWGAVWWYGFLTSQMQRAGPTFTKVFA